MQTEYNSPPSSRQKRNKMASHFASVTAEEIGYALGPLVIRLVRYLLFWLSVKAVDIYLHFG